MKITVYIILANFLVGCTNQLRIKPETSVNSADTVKTSQLSDTIGKSINDTSSVEYLVQLLQKDLPLNSYWMQKLTGTGDYWFLHSRDLKMNLSKTWKVTDSISALIISYSTGVSADNVLYTLDRTNRFISFLHIAEEGDRDLSREEYSYTEYEMPDNNTIRLKKHELKGPEQSETEKISTEIWTIKNNGLIMKRE